MVDSEVRKVESWKLQCHAILDPLIGNLGSLSEGLEKIKYSFERALAIYKGSNGNRKTMLCVCNSNNLENKEAYTCLTCQDRFHLSCMNPPPIRDDGYTDGPSCPFCLCIENGVFSRSGGLAVICRENRPQMKSFSDLSSAGSLFKGLPEVNLMEEIIQLALQCSSCLTEIIKQALSHSEQDLSSVSESLLTAIKAVYVAGIDDHQVSCTLKSAVSRNAWKHRVKRLMKGSKKPVFQQIQRLMKEGLAFCIPPEDYYLKKIATAQEISLHWVEIAKKVASDGGELALREVYKLIKDGENLPIHFDKELKLLRARSMLYCICRKPYDQRAMIACDQCDEWYHFDCINLQNPPKTFYCPACQPATGEFISLACPIYSEVRSNNECEPRTPPAFDNDSKWKNLRKVESCSQQKVQNRVDLIDILRSSSDLEQLWREKKRPHRRTARRHIKLEEPS